MFNNLPGGKTYPNFSGWVRVHGLPFDTFMEELCKAYLYRPAHLPKY